MNPTLSIITVTYNGWENTARLLASIQEHTLVPHETIVVSNGPNTAGYTGGIHSNKFIANARNLGWTSGVNQGLAVAEGEYVAWCNDDTEVTAGWAERMISVLDLNDGIGLVGPMTNYASGRQQGEAVGVGGFEISPRLVGFCMMTRAEVIEEVGGLDERFATYGFDDDDYTLRVQRAGYLAAIARGAYVKHVGHDTYNREGISLGDGLLKGWEAFKGKWDLPPDLPYGSPIPYDRLMLRPPNPDTDYFPVSEHAVHPG